MKQLIRLKQSVKERLKRGADTKEAFADLDAGIKAAAEAADKLGAARGKVLQLASDSRISNKAVASTLTRSETPFEPPTDQAA